MLRTVGFVFLCCAPVKTLSVPSLDVRLVEGTRSLVDAFPYLAASGRQIRPGTVAAVVPKVADANTALAVARLFVAGVPVRERKKAEELIATARALKKELKHLEVRIHDFRPKSFEPVVEETREGWTVTMVAFEMDRFLQLVQIRATVGERVEIVRTPIVAGPMTSWQTAFITGQEANAEQAMRREAELARQRYAKALRPPRTPDTAWAIARLHLKPKQIHDLWPVSKLVPTHNRRLSMVELSDKTWAVYDGFERDRPVRKFWQAKKPTADGKHPGETIRVFADG